MRSGSRRNATVHRFLELGGDLTLADKEKQETPVHFVCRQNGPAMLKVMLPYMGEALKIKDKTGSTPIDYAKAFKDKKSEDGAEETVYTILESTY